MTENLWPKDRGLQARFSVLSNLLGWAWLFPGAHILPQSINRAQCAAPAPGEFRNVFPFLPKPFFPDRY